MSLLSSVSLISSTTICLIRNNPVDISQSLKLGFLSIAIEEGFQKAGDLLGLDQSTIDLLQGITQLGIANDGGGFLINMKEAAESFMAELPASDREFLQNTIGRVSDSIADLIMSFISQTSQGQRELADNTMNDEQEEEGGVKSFFEVIAETLGKILGEKAANMMESLEKLESAGGEAINPKTEKAYTDKERKADPTGFAEATRKQTEEFTVAQTKFTSDSQIYSMMSNLCNTSLKSMGESMITMAKRQ